MYIYQGHMCFLRADLLLILKSISPFSFRATAVTLTLLAQRKLFFFVVVVDVESHVVNDRVLCCFRFTAALIELSCGFLLFSARLRAVATGSDGGLEGFKAYPVFKEIEDLLREVKEIISESCGFVLTFK